MSQTEAEIVACLAAEFDRTLDLVQFSPSHVLLDVAVHSVGYRVALTHLDGLPGDHEVLIELHAWIICKSTGIAWQSKSALTGVFR